MTDAKPLAFATIAIDDIAADFARLIDELDPDTIWSGVLAKASLEPCWLVLETCTLDQAVAAKQAAELASIDGWLRRQSVHQLLPRDQGLAVDQPPLHGEWCAGTTGFSLRLVGPGQWSFVTVMELPANADRGETVLAETVHVTGRAGVAALVYRVYYGADISRPSELRRIASRLQAIEFNSIT